MAFDDILNKLLLGAVRAKDSYSDLIDESDRRSEEIGRGILGDKHYDVLAKDGFTPVGMASDIAGGTQGITKAEKVLGRGAGKVANAIANKIIDPTESGRAMRDYDMINDELFKNMGLRKRAMKNNLKYLDDGADKNVFVSKDHPNQVLKVTKNNSFAQGNTIREQAILNELNERGLAPATRSYVVGNKEFQTQSRVMPYGNNREEIDNIIGSSDARSNLVDEINSTETMLANDVHDGNWGISSPFATNFDEALKTGASKMSRTGEMHPDIVKENIDPNILSLLKDQSEKMRVEPGGKIRNIDPIVFDVSRFGTDVSELMGVPTAFEKLKRTIKTTNPQVTEAMHLFSNNSVPPEIAKKARQAAKVKKIEEFNDMVNIDGNNREQLEPFVKKLEQLAGENAGNRNYDNIQKVINQIKGPYEFDANPGFGAEDISKYNVNELLDAAVNNSNMMDTLYKDDALVELYNRLMNATTKNDKQLQLFGQTDDINRLKFNTQDFIAERARLADKKKLNNLIGDLMPISKEDTQHVVDANHLGNIINDVRGKGLQLSKEDADIYKQLREKVGKKLKDRRIDAYKKVKK